MRLRAVLRARAICRRANRAPRSHRTRRDRARSRLAGAFEHEARRENAEPFEERTLAIVEKIVAPIDERSQRLPDAVRRRARYRSTRETARRAGRGDRARRARGPARPRVRSRAECRRGAGRSPRRSSAFASVSSNDRPCARARSTKSAIEAWKRRLARADMSALARGRKREAKAADRRSLPRFREPGDSRLGS